MGILIFIILIVGIVILVCKKFNGKKKVIMIALIILITIGAVIVLQDKLVYLIHKNQPTITQEEKEQAIAVVQYSNIEIDNGFCENYYIYQKENNKYYYFRTAYHDTIAGPQEEKINKKGNINSRKQLEKIINNFEKKATSNNTSKSATIRYFYNGAKIEKEELINKLFN